MASRVAKNPVNLPTGIEATINGQLLTIKGSKGSLTEKIPTEVNIAKENGSITFTIAKTRTSAEQANALAGTTRANVNNMVLGVSKGFELKLVLMGVGYRAQVQGKALNLTVGHSHPVSYKAPEGITIETPSQTEILIKGINKQLVGQVAAEIRSFRSPEPYKGKGVRYHNEVVILKEAKKK